MHADVEPWDIEDGPRRCDNCNSILELVEVPHPNPASHWPMRWHYIDVCEVCGVQYDNNGNIVRDEEEISNASEEESSKESSAKSKSSTRKGAEALHRG